MSFLRLQNELALRVVDWGLPARIIVAFFAALEDRFGNLDPADVPTSRKLGMNDNLVVVDPSDDRQRYIFFLRFARNDDDFWVTDVSCMGVDTANKIFWTMPD